MKRPVTRSLPLLLLLTLLFSACAKTGTEDRALEDAGGANAGGFCTQLGCISGFGVTLSANDEELPNGTYEVWAQIDGTRLERCTIVTQTGQTTKTGACENLSWTQWGGKTSIGELIYRVSQGEVSMLVVAFVKDGLVLAQREVHPVYQNIYPNGERCGGACRSAASVMIRMDL